MSQGDLGDLANLDTQTLLEHLPGVRFPADEEAHNALPAHEDEEESEHSDREPVVTQ